MTKEVDVTSKPPFFNYTTAPHWHFDYGPWEQKGNVPSAPLKKKKPISKVKVGLAPSPDLENVTPKVQSWHWHWSLDVGTEEEESQSRY
jgi:hypothetical protein